VLDALEPDRRKTRIDVVFSRRGSGFQVDVHAEGAVVGERHIEDLGPSCASLSDAASLVLALLARPSPAVAEPRGPDGPSAGLALAAVDTSFAPTRSAFSLIVGGGASVGVVRPLAPGIALGATWRQDAWVAELDLDLVLPSALPLAPGTVTAWLLDARAFGCRVLIGGTSAVALGACAGAAAARLAAAATGFTVDRTASRPWFAAGAAVRGEGPIAGPLGWRLIAGAEVALATEGFRVDNVGVAYKPSRIAGFGAVGLAWSFE
jgi:hypothetical protein